MRQSIRGYADGVIDQVPDEQLGAIAGELAGVRDVIAGSEDLAGVLADSGVPLASRRAVSSELFGSRVSETTTRLLNYTLDEGRPADAVDDIAWLAERLDAAARKHVPGGVTVLGHRAAEERVSGYATAVLESVERPELGNIEDELFRFQRIVAGSDELRDALASRYLPPAARKALVTDLIGAKATASTTKLATYATQVGRPHDYEDLLSALVDRVALETNRRVADVRSAIELDAGQQEKLAAALARSIGHDVEVRVTVDPSVVAGFVATIGDTVVDGSARRQLELLKERLASSETSSTPRAPGASSNVTTGERH